MTTLAAVPHRAGAPAALVEGGRIGMEDMELADELDVACLGVAEVHPARLKKRLRLHRARLRPALLGRPRDPPGQPARDQPACGRAHPTPARGRPGWGRLGSRARGHRPDAT